MAETPWQQAAAFDLWFYAPDRERAPLVEYVATRLYAERVYRETFTLDAEKSADDRMTICCSRAHTAELTLDL
jgi:hypothetical protein